MKLDDVVDVKVHTVDSQVHKFTTLRSALLYVWDRSDEVTAVLVDNAQLTIKDGYLWK